MILIGLSTTAQAQSVIFHGISYHSHGSYNNYNYGFGYLFENRFMVGAYKNSQNSNSAYVGYNWKYNEYLSVSVLGAVGYKEFPVMALVLPTISVPVIQNIYLNIAATPLYNKSFNKFGILLNSSLEYRF